MVYRIGEGFAPSLADVQAALEPVQFVECGASQEKSIGWVPPRGEAHGPLVESVAGQWILKLMIESKAVPGNVVRRKADERIAEIEAATGRKPGKKEKRDLMDDVLLSLLPQAFARQSSVIVWMDLENRRLVLNAGSQGKADEVMSALMNVLAGLSVSLIQTVTSPQAAMTQWLLAPTEDEWPADLTVERETVLKSTGEDAASVRFTRHHLANDDVRKHVMEGKLPTQLAWTSRATAPRAMSSDFIFTGKGEAGANTTQVRLFDDANNNAVLDAGEELTVTSGSAVDSSGNFSAAIRAWSMAEGVHLIRALQTDLAGNTSVASEALRLTVDRSPQPPLTIDLAPGQDNGLFADDKITSHARPTFRVTLAPQARAGDRIELYNAMTTHPSYLIGSVQLSANDLARGHVDVTSTKDLSGTYNPYAGSYSGIYGRTVDAAGNPQNLNVDPSSNPTSLYRYIGAMPRLYVDVNGVPGAPNMTFLAADQGPGSTGNSIVTRQATGFTLTGTTAGTNASQVNFYAGDTLLGSVKPGDMGSAYSFTYAGPALADGVYTVYARGVRANGVEGPASAALFVRVDARAFDPSFLWLDSTDDTGPVKGDGITSPANAARNITLSGLARPGATVVLFDDIDADGVLDAGEALTTYTANTTTALASVTAHATTGAFSADVILSSGAHRILAQQTVGSQVSLIGSVLPITIDVDVPLTPTFAQLTAVNGLDVINDDGARVSSSPNPSLDMRLPEGVKEGDEVLLLNGSTVLIRQSITLRDLASATARLDITPASKLVDGTYNTLSVRILDRAGNASPDLKLPPLIISTAGLAASTALDLIDDDDTGPSITDNRTQRSTGLTLTGTSPVGTVSLRIYDGKTLLGETYPGFDADAPQFFSFTYTGKPLTPGVHPLSVRAVDLVGTEGTPASLSVVIDDSLLPPSRLVLDPAADSGSSKTDLITNTVSSIGLSGKAEPGSTVQVFDDQNDNNLVDHGEWLATVTANASTGAFAVSVSLGSGEHKLRAIASDVQGNTSLASASLALTVDRQPPSPPVSLALAPGQDTGLSSIDRLTNLSRAVLRVGLPSDVQVGDVVWISQPGNYYTTLNAYSTSYTVTLADLPVSGRGYVDITLANDLYETPPGAYSNNGVNWVLSAYIIDQAGNIGQRLVVPTLQVDYTAPAAPTGLNLSDAQDSGRSLTDNITGIGTGFTIKGAMTSGTRRIEVFEGSTSLGFASLLSDTAWSFTYTGASYSQTTRAFTARALDESGNFGPLSVPLVVAFDTLPGASLLPPKWSAASDSGRLSNDGITNVSTGVTFTGYADPSVVTTVRVRLYNDRNNDAKVDSLELLATANTNGNGLYTFSNIFLSPGTHYLRVAQEDIAGHWSAISAAAVLVVDELAPERPTVTLQATDDTTPVLRGTYDAANTDLLTVRLNNVAYGVSAGRTVTIGGGTLTTVAGLVLDAANGTWQLALRPSEALALAAAPYEVIVQATDLAGNTSVDSSANELLLRAAPTDTLAPTFVRLAPGSDTGYLASDASTAKLAPVLRVGLSLRAVEGDVLRVLQGSTELTRYTLSASDIARAYVDLQGQTLLTSGTDYTGTAAISASVLRLQATGTLESAATALSRLEIDQAPPSTLAAPNLETGSDSGASNTDNRLRFGNGFTFYGTVGNSDVVQVLLYANGVYLGSTGVRSDLNYVFTLPATATALAAGSQAITAVAVDEAGNRSAMSAALTLSIDTRVEAPKNLWLVATSDSGAKDDWRTRTATNLVIKGQGEVGATVTAFDDLNLNGVADPGEALAGSATVTAAGTFSLTLTSTLAEGQHQIRLVQTDVTGNISAPSSALPVVVDSVVQRPISVALAPGQDNGTSLIDSVVATARPTFRVNLAPDALAGDTMQLYKTASFSGANLIGQRLLTALDIARGYVDLKSTQNLSGNYDGTQSTGIYARMIDQAGNASGFSNTRGNLPWVTVDTTLPAAPGSLALLTQDDTGISAADNITALDTGFTLQATGADEGIRFIEVWDSQTLLMRAPVGSVNQINVTYDGPALTPGLHTLSARFIDKAGNAGPFATPMRLLVDTTEKVQVLGMGQLGLRAAYDSGYSRNDAVTNTNAFWLDGMLAAGAMVQIFEDLNNDGVYSLGEAVGAPTNTFVTTGAFGLSLTLGTGTHRLRAVAYNANTGMTIGEVSEALQITIKTTPPGRPGVVDVLASSDTPVDLAVQGVSAADRVTSDTTPSLRVALPADAAVGDRLSLYNGSTVLYALSLSAAQVQTGVAEFTLPDMLALAAGTYTLTASLTDRAGNEGEKSPATYPLVVDTTGPSISTAPNLSASSDSGTSSTDNLTQRNTGLSLSGSVPADTVRVLVYDTRADTTQMRTGSYNPGAGLTLSVADVAQYAVQGVELAYPAGVASVNISNAYLDGAGIGAPVPAVAYRDTGSADRWLLASFDAASNTTRMVALSLSLAADGSLLARSAGAAWARGNQSTDASLLNAAWLQPVSTIAIAGSGAGGGYDITSFDFSYTPTQTVQMGEATLTGSNYSFNTGSAQPLAAGAHSFSVAAIDAAGNVGARSALRTVLVDTAISRPNLVMGTASADGGVTRALTNTGTVARFSGNTEPGARVVVFDDLNNNSQVDADEQMAEVTANAYGQFNADGAVLSAGSHNVRAIAFDKAGNQSLASQAVSLNIDLQPPMAPVGIALLGSSDGGQRSDDAFTAAGRDLTFRVSLNTADIREGETVSVLNAGTLLASTPVTAAMLSAGYADIKVSAGTLAANTYNDTIRAQITDAAGNAGATVSMPSLTVKAAPAALAAPDLIAEDDSFATAASGSNNSGTSADNITRISTGFTLSGTIGADVVSVEVYDDSSATTPIGVAQVDRSNSTWRFTYSGVPYADVTRGFSVKAVDLAGNTSAASAWLWVAFDSNGPAKLPPLTLDSPDDTTPAGDGITRNSSALTLKGFADRGAKVLVFDDADGNGLINTGELLGSVNADSTTGAFTLDVNLPQGTHALRAVQLDRAGNLSVASQTFSLSVDLTPPDRPTVDPLAVKGQFPPNNLITNADFETDAVAAGTIQGSITPAGWTKVGSNSIDTGLYDPSTAFYGYPANNNMAYIYQPNVAGGVQFYQDTTTTLSTGDLLTLSVDVAHPLVVGGHVALFRTDGSTATLLSRRVITTSDLGADGTFKNLSISYTALAQDAGQRVRVLYGTPQDATANAYLDLDNFRLTRQSAAQLAMTAAGNWPVSTTLTGGFDKLNTASLSVTVDGNSYTSSNGLVLDATQGSWRLTVPTSSFSSANPIVTVTASDAAGNSMGNVETQPLLVVNDATPLWAAPKLLNPTGTEATFSSSAQVSLRQALATGVSSGDTLTLKQGSTSVLSYTLTATDVARGYADLSATLASTSSNPITVDYRVGGAGDVVARSYLPMLRIDTTAPAVAPAQPTLLSADDAALAGGAANTDLNIAINTGFTLTGTASSGQGVTRIQVLDQAGPTATVLGHADVKADNTYVFVYTGQPLADGVHRLSVVELDAAGNSAQRLSHASNLTTTATSTGLSASRLDAVELSSAIMNGKSVDGGPSANASFVRMTGSTDTWIAVYNNAVQTKMVAVVLSTSGTTLQIRSTGARFWAHGGNLAQTAAAVNAAWTAGTAMTLATTGSADGYGLVNITGSVSNRSADRVVTIDTRVSPLSAPTLTTASDSGNLSNDGMTRNTSLTVTGTAEAGATVQVFRDRNGNAHMDDGELLGTATLSGTTYSLGLTLPAGTHSLYALATNVAGAMSVSAVSTVVVDTLAQRPTGIQVMAGDNGVFAADGIVSHLQPTVRVSLPAQALVGDKIRLYSADNTTSVLATLLLSQADKDRGYVDFDPRDGVTTESVLSFTGNGYVNFSLNEPETSVSREIVFQTTTGGGLFAVSSGGAYDRGLWVTPDGNIGSYVWNSEVIYTTGLNLTDGAVHRVVFTLGARGTDIHVDGVLRVQGNRTSSDYNWDTEQRLGHAFHGGYFDGQILNYRTWNQQLSTVDARALSAGTAITPVASHTLGFTAGGATITDTPGAGVAVISTFSKVGTVGSGFTLAADTVYTNAISARLEDQAGNLSASVVLPRYTTDNTAPATPTVTLLNSDTGSSNTDRITRMSRGFTLSGTATSGALVSIFDGEVLIGTAPVLANNSWVWTHSGDALSSGIHNILVRSSDAAGNLSAYSSTLVLDFEDSATTPVKAYANRLWIGNNASVDTGNPDDNLISGNSISLTGRMAPNATVWLYNDRNNNGLLDSGELISTSLSTDAAGLLTASTVTLPGGVNRLRAIALDGQGQLIGTQSDALVVTSQRTMPMLPGTPRLLAADGVTPDEDGLTVLAQPSFRIDLPVTGDGVVQVGDQVVMKNNTTELARASVTASDIAQGFVVLKVLPNQALAAANYNNLISVQLIDGAGSISQAATVTTLTVAGGLPSSAVFSIAPTVASDLGASAYDRITNTTSPTLRVYLGTGAAVGGVVEVFNASTTGTNDANRKGTATLTAAHLSQGYVDVATSALATGTGTNYFRYTASGASKSATTGAVVSIPNLTIDTTAPVLAVGLNLADSDDTGRSSSDNNTRLNQIVTLNATGTVSNAAEIAWLNVYDGSQLIGRASLGNMQWGIVFSFTLPAGVTLSDGLHRFAVRPVDFAGNEGGAVSLDVTIDATAPTGLTASLASADLTDTVNRLTSNVNALTLSGAAEANARISVFNDSNNNGRRDLGEDHLALYTKDTGTVITSTVVADGAGAYTVDLRGLAVGAYNLRVVQTDVAGNEQVSTAVAFTVDTSALAPPSMVLLASSDTGDSPYDGKTNDNTPTFRIALPGDAVPGEKVRINTSSVVTGTQLGLVTLQAVDIAKGFIEFTPTTAMNAGTAVTYSAGTAVTAFMIDRAGNASAGVTLRTALVVDNALPTAPAAAPDLLTVDDTGTFSTDVTNTDNRVNRGTDLSFASSGALPAGTTRVELFDTFGGVTQSLGFAAMPSTTTWAFTYQGPALANGTHAITWRAWDVGGNRGPASAALSLVVDTAGALPLVPTLGSDTATALRVALKNAAADDTGTLGDNVTKSRSPTLVGVAEPGARISIYEDRNGSGVVEPSELVLNALNARYVVAHASTGVFEFQLSAYQKAGVHRYIVVQNDVAGNMVASAPLSITIDFTATKPLWLNLRETASVDSGHLNNDKITNAPPQVVMRLPADARVGDTARVRVLNYLNGTAHTTVDALLSAADIDAGQVLFALTRDQMKGNTPGNYYVDGAIVDAAGNTPLYKGLNPGSVTGSYNLLYETRPPADPFTASLYLGDGSNSTTTASLAARTASTTLNRMFTLEGALPTRAATDSLADVVKVQVYDRVGSSLYLLGEAGVKSAANAWALTYDGSALKQGAHSIVLRSVDMAGNVSATDAELLATTSVLTLTVNNAQVLTEPTDRVRPQLLGGLSFNGDLITLNLSEAVQS
eukprot:gene8299-9871_t